MSQNSEEEILDSFTTQNSNIPNVSTLASDQTQNSSNKR